MVRFGRLLIVALLVALIPAKGFAAALMLFCGMSHDRAPVIEHAQLGMAVGSDQTEIQARCHDAAAHSEDGSAPSHEGSCSVCAVCSTAASVIAGDAGRYPYALSALEPPSLRPAHFADHVPPTLDRPPLA